MEVDRNEVVDKYDEYLSQLGEERKSWNRDLLALPVEYISDSGMMRSTIHSQFSDYIRKRRRRVVRCDKRVGRKKKKTYLAL